MSEEKLYMVKNDEDKCWDFDFAGFWRRELPGYYAVTSKKRAEIVVDERGGHVVTLIEEPEKVVLTKEQAEIVEEAHIDEYPATYISDNTGMCDDDNDEILLMNAYVNGYTVAGEKKYLVYKKLGGKHTADVQYAQASRVSAHSETLSWIITSWIITDGTTNGSFFQFTKAEIEHYGLQDCEKVECD